MAEPERSAIPDPEARYRRRRLAGLLLGLSLLLILVNTGQWLEHARLRDRLEQEVGDRLLMVARLSAAQVDGEMVLRWLAWGIDPDEDDRLRATLGTVAEGGAIANVVLLDLDGGSIVDLAGVDRFGELNTVVVLDRAEFTAASTGVPVATALRRVDDVARDRGTTWEHLTGRSREEAAAVGTSGDKSDG